MSLNPVSTSNFIFNRFSGYASTSLQVNDEKINRQLTKLLKEPNSFSKGPIIEATPSYVTGLNILEMVEKGILNDGFSDFNSPSLPLDRKLYLHQETAIEKVCRDSRNIVVSTGTGSGKTESFMIPIIDHLLELKNGEKLRPGVKALLLYPMNALANDQIKRLRGLLKNEPEITFGIYTGETEETYDNALDKFVRMHGENPLSNELISREQMKETPPHILITNYAMLEYLMLRPEDNVFFEGGFSHDWKFIVIDEAHTYTGAKGIEMSMLLSRLKNTIGLEKGQLKCILTSASLGSGRKDFPKVADFAKKLFAEEFTENDVVEATKEKLELRSEWGKPSHDFYINAIKSIEDDDQDKLKKIMLEANIPEPVINNAYKEPKKKTKAILYSVLIGDKRVNAAISRLSNGPIDFVSLSEEIFQGNNNPSECMASLIDLCNQVRRSENHSPLIPARYHYFIRALEGAFLVFAEEPQIYLDRMNKVTIEGEDYKSFEIGTCRRCNSLYLVGEVEKDELTGFSYLKEYENRYFEDDKSIEYFAILENDSYEDVVNEDEQIIDLKANPFTIFKICTKCGAIREDIGKDTCDCTNTKKIKLLKVRSKDKHVKKCGVCGGVNPIGSIVKRFFLAEDTVSSVLATALYNKIPNKTNKSKKINEDFNIFGDNEDENKVNKQLLIFSDNRQSAAYFSTYLDSSYSDMLVKSILTKVILDNKQASMVNSWSLEDFHRRIDKFVRDNNIFIKTTETRNKEIWKWIIGEFISNSSNSLVKMGYLHFSPNTDMINNYSKLITVPFLQKDGFSVEEIEHLIKYLLEEFRVQRAIEYPELVDPTDEYFAPINLQGGFGRIIPQSSKKFKKGYSIKSWIPSKNIYNNSRSDYISKVYESKGITLDNDQKHIMLENLYEILTYKSSPFNPFIKREHTKEYGEIIKMDPLAYKVTPGIYDNNVKYYKCDECHKTTTINISNICPSYRCEGLLKSIDIEEEYKDNHYRNLFTSFAFEKMDVSEHTAQLKTEYAAEVQNKFINGDINVLSCSTTFELGVDVGELETVFMKNMPPTPANYAQRAGRAGRRLDSTAYALTYARLGSHDFSNFADPYKMISGTIKPPYFEVNNAKIARRHMYACALSKFWRQYNDYFKTVDDFFINKEKSGPELFKEFLGKKPIELFDLIRKAIPEELHEELKIDNWGWVDNLYSENGVMTKITSELNDDLERLLKAENEAASNGKYYLANELQRTMNTIKSRPLINYLSQKNLLPKYGFPVDVVNLEANFHTDDAKNVELNRDLQIAISEYAPESQVVANGKLWTSRYIKKVRKKDLERHKFFSCKCGYFETDISVSDKEITSCPVCGDSIKNSGIYMMPEFGFITEKDLKKPGKTRPERTYSSRKHFSGNGDIVEEKDFLFDDTTIRVNAQNHGLLTVINNGKGRGFQICKTCGFGTSGIKPSNHRNPEGKDCRGMFERVSLGYDFETDIVEIDFSNSFDDIEIEDGFWESLMYSILEGMSSSLEIDRGDIDGTLYAKGAESKSIILFDTVPGGAGHVKGLLKEENFRISLENALNKVSSCSCGGENKDTSCYNCLRNYYNQYCHDKLKRIYAIEGLEEILVKELAEA